MLIPRGRKLVLEYTGGSPCATNLPKARPRALSTVADAAGPAPRAVHEGAKYRYYDDGDGSGSAAATPPGNASSAAPAAAAAEDAPASTTRRKSLTISFLCDRDPLNTLAAASFINTDPDECAYFFEVRSQHACAGAEPHKPGSVGPGSVFAIIFFIAVLVYVVGGVFYQRTVTHARGWRQLPNYSIWAGIFGFLRVRPCLCLAAGRPLHAVEPPPANLALSRTWWSS